VARIKLWGWKGKRDYYSPEKKGYVRANVPEKPAADSGGGSSQGGFDPFAPSDDTGGGGGEGGSSSQNGFDPFNP